MHSYTSKPFLSKCTLLIISMFLSSLFLSTTSFADTIEDTSPTETDYYNVNTYGAYGNDDLDDTEAIQAALDEATEDTISVITIPEGIYYISETLYIQSNTTLQLTPNTTIYRRDNGSPSDKLLGFNLLKTADASYISYDYPGYTLAHNITISGGIWDGGDIATATKVSNLIYMGHSSDILIENATIRNCYGSHAIEFAGIQNGTIRNCTFSDFRYGPNNYTSEAIQLDICYDDGRDDWTPGFLHDKTVCSNILIENNTITDYPRGIGSHHVLSGHRSNNITIRNNYIKRSSTNTQYKAQIGIFLMGTSNVSIYENTLYYYYYGVMAKFSDHLKISNNKFKNNLSGGISISNCDVKSRNRRFYVVKTKFKKKTIEYTAQGISKGYCKTRGKANRFYKGKKLHTVKLKKEIKNHQKFTFFGTDNQGNKYYKTFYAVKSSKSK